jgi:hypothetical protein
MITAMTTALTYLLLTAVLLAPFALIGAIAARAHRDGHLRWRIGCSKTIPTCAASATTSTPCAPASRKTPAGRSQERSANDVKNSSTAC